MRPFNPSTGSTSSRAKSKDDSAQGKSSRAYGRLLWLLRGRDPDELHAIGDDAERLLDAARANGRVAVSATWLALIRDLVVATAHDMAQALRSLVRAPGFTVTVSLLLGL